MTMLSIKDVSFAFEQRSILNNFSLELSSGEIVALLGPSGSGKTTLFRLITRLEKLSSGTILPEPSQIGYMMQNDLLLPWKTVKENLQLFNCHNDVALRELLELVNISHCLNMYPRELSGGMRQRVSLLRTLLQKQPILLLDEPFSSLDFVIKEQIYTLIRKRHQETRQTILYITHDFHDALLLADRICLLEDGKIGMQWQVPSDLLKNESAFFTMHQAIREYLRLSHAS